MQRSRLNGEHEEVPIKSETTGELPRPTDQSEEQDGGAAVYKIGQGAGNDEGLLTEQEIITGSYRWDVWDTAGPAKGQCGTARPGEGHDEGSCLDAACGSWLEGPCPILSKLAWLLNEALEAITHPVPQPIPQPHPLPAGPTLGKDASGEKWGGLGEGGSTSIEFQNPFTQSSCHPTK